MEKRISKYDTQQTNVTPILYVQDTADQTSLFLIYNQSINLNHLQALFCKRFWVLCSSLHIIFIVIKSIERDIVTSLFYFIFFVYSTSLLLHVWTTIQLCTFKNHIDSQFCNFFFMFCFQTLPGAACDCRQLAQMMTVLCNLTFLRNRTILYNLHTVYEVCQPLTTDERVIYL